MRLNLEGVCTYRDVRNRTARAIVTARRNGEPIKGNYRETLPAEQRRLLNFSDNIPNEEIVHPIEISIPTVTERIATLVPKLSAIDPTLPEFFASTYTSVLKDMTYKGKDTESVVICCSNDIPGAWLRDGCASVMPFVRDCPDDKAADFLVKGTINEFAVRINIDPYANAYTLTRDGQYSPRARERDVTKKIPGVWERKLEVDSLCYFLNLLRRYTDKMQDKTLYKKPIIKRAIERILTVMETEQHHDKTSPYVFKQKLDNVDTTREVLNTGMIWSLYHPSDSPLDGFNIASQLFAVTELKHLKEATPIGLKNKNRADSIMKGVTQGIAKYGLKYVPGYGEVFVSDVDRLGRKKLGDDANIPSLLALPFMEYCDTNDPLYQRTRKFILSSQNPNYFVGKYARGIGSAEHTKTEWVWPLSLIAEGLTTNDPTERESIIRTICRLHQGRKHINETVNQNNPAQYSREVFVWADEMFAELVLRHFGM